MERAPEETWQEDAEGRLLLCVEQAFAEVFPEGGAWRARVVFQSGLLARTRRTYATAAEAQAEVLGILGLSEGTGLSLERPPTSNVL